jgi:1-acyl-sn-glycerol-3-phosphate acyltransferase
VGLLDRLRQLRGAVPDDDIAGRAEALVVRGNEFGYDEFGLSRDSFRGAARVAAWLYRSYFRASAFGIDNIPATGRVLFVANHSGQLPFDGLVIGSACFLEPPQPRLVRSMVEYFVPTVPFVSYLLARWGQITGTPENCRRLLAAEEAVLVFPEGARGISKPFSKRYQLAEFGTGFMRLALEMQAPIVPIAVIGAEEQAPAINVKPLARLLGAPSFPVVPYPPFVPFVPLPVKYRLYFGDPMAFTGDPDDDDEVLDEKARIVKSRIQSMIHVGLREREHVFW